MNLYQTQTIFNLKESVAILFVEDVEDDYELILLELQRSPLQIDSTRVDSEKELIKELESKHYDLVISDNNLPGLNAKEVLDIVKKYQKALPVILVSGSIGEQAAVELMRQGASDYILKSNLKRLSPAVSREISDYKQRIKQLENSKNLILSELRYQNLTESIQDIFFAIDVNLEITFWNISATEEFGVEVQVGEKIFDVFPTWKNEPIGHAILKSIDDGETIPIQLTYMIKELEYFEGTVSNAGNGATILLQKVTERYLNRERLENLNRELETLLYRIGHDLKGPVSSVAGLINIMSNDDDYDKEKFLSMMAARMRNLDNTLLILRDLANIKYGSSKNIEINLLYILEQIIEGLDVTASCKRECIKLSIDQNIIFQGDQSLIYSICYNLLENAAKYGGKDSEAKITVSAVNTNGILELTVSDEGPGITEDIKERIFDMFYRGDYRSEGSGLGLYIVKNALMKINGHIELDSEYTQGARFKVQIPTLINN